MNFTVMNVFLCVWMNLFKIFNAHVQNHWQK